MAVLNSNLMRFLLIASLLLSACANLESTANDLVENSAIQEVTGAGESTNDASDTASEAQGKGESNLQVTPTLSVTNEPTEEPTIVEEATPSPTAEDSKEASPTPEPTEESSPTPEITPTVTSIPEPTPLPVSITSKTADMLLIMGGEFEMGEEASRLLEECALFREGCDEGWFSSSQPIHLVQIKPFYLDVYEVTNEAFLEFLNGLEDVEAGCEGQLCFNESDSQIEADGEGQYVVDESFFEHPLAGATWYGASAYCEWRDARLPTEAEWELAASWDSENGNKSFYPWGDEFDGSAINYCDVNCEETHASSEFDDGFANTAPVGSYENGRSPVGAYDMAGNVWEWVNDWFDDEYYRQSPEANPGGSEDGDSKVVRGGSWIDTGNFAATSVRFPAPPVESGNSIGFRCAVNAIPEEEVLAQAPEEEPTAEVVEEVAEETTEEATAEVVEEVAEETTEEATEEVVEEVAEETTEEATEEVAEETTEEAAAEDSETPPAPVSINCDLYPGVDNGDTYIVGACDWLTKIANSLGVSYSALLAANPQIQDPNLIYPGQVLNMPPRPDASGSPPPSTSPPDSPQPPTPQPPQPPGGGLGG